MGMVTNEVQEELVNAGVVAELGMKSGGEDVTLTDEHGVCFARGEGFDGCAGAGDAGGADEDHLEGAAGESGVGVEDGGVDLAAVCVSLDGDVEGAEGFLGGVLDVCGEEDGTSARAEGGGGLDEGLEGIEEVVALKEFEHGGGFAAGHDEAVHKCGTVGTFKVGWEADELGYGSEGAERFGVGFVGALEGEDAYDEGLGGHRTDTRLAGRQDETECRTGYVS